MLKSSNTINPFRQKAVSVVSIRTRNLDSKLKKQSKTQCDVSVHAAPGWLLQSISVVFAYSPRDRRRRIFQSFHLNLGEPLNWYATPDDFLLYRKDITMVCYISHSYAT